VYLPKAVIGDCEKSYFGSICNYSVMVFETSIYNYNNLPETPMIKECDVELKDKKKKSLRSAENNELVLKIESFIKRNYKSTHSKVKIIKLGISSRTSSCDEFKKPAISGLFLWDIGAC
jgi:hypothetical protein